MGIKQTDSQIINMVELEILTAENTNLKKLMAEKIGPNSLGCSYIGGINLGRIDGEAYHCFGATVIVHEGSLSIISEDIPKAHGELERVLGLSLIFPIGREFYHDQNDKTKSLQSMQHDL